MRPATRIEWQQQIEQSIVDFNGDAIEASEILDAVMRGLKNRYDRGELADVEHEYEQLKEALDEMHCTQGNEAMDWLVEEQYEQWASIEEEQHG